MSRGRYEAINFKFIIELENLVCEDDNINCKVSFNSNLRESFWCKDNGEDWDIDEKDGVIVTKWQDRADTKNLTLVLKIF